MLTEEIQVAVCTGGVGNAFGTQWNYNIINADSGNYPDGSPLIKHALPVQADALILRPTSLESFVKGMFLADAYAERGKRIPNLILPFIPGGRQDRLNPAGDFLFTLKSVGKMINERKFDTVTTIDPHSNVSGMAIDRLQVYPIANMLGNFYVGYDAVIAPDAGAGHRAQEAASILGVLRGTPMPVIQAEKTRDVETGKLSGFAVNVEKGKHYLVFDDICDGGGTFVGLGEKIREQGANAGLFVTHGIFSKGLDTLNSIYKVVTTTDSTLFDKGDARVIDVTGRMLSWHK